MGGLIGKRAPENDPFYNPVPPPSTVPPGYDPSGGLGAYDPSEEYEYDPAYYGRPIKPRPNIYGGRYAQGFNQITSVAPWNYGNYYLGNTTMQMMPYMLNKIHRYGQIQAISALGNAGLLGSGFGNAGLLGSGFGNAGLLGSGFGNAGLLGSGFGNAGLIGSAPMMPSMPMMPCCLPSSFSMPMATPMMAAATPLPVAFNPLVQGMYPMASMNPVNWMTPSSFMSALTSGPMPYRPPAFDFPSNVGMVMTIPYGTPNPLLSSSSYGSFGSSYNFGSGFSWNCCCYSMPPVSVSAPPTVSYYPRPVNVPQPYYVPYPAPVPIPNVQQVPVPRPVSVVAPPIVAGSNYSLPVSAGVPLSPSQGVFTGGNFGRPAVMASNNNSTTQAIINNRSTSGSLPVYDPTDKSHLLIGQPVVSSLSNIGSNNNERAGVTPSTAKNAQQIGQNRDTISARFLRHLPSISRLSRSNYTFNMPQPRSDPVLPPILRGQLISDSGWLPKTAKIPSITSILSGKKGKRPLYTINDGKSTHYLSSSGASLLKRRRRRSSSSVSEYDCAICQQERDKRHLHEYYGSSTLSSLLSSPKGSHKRHLSSNESALSSIVRSPTSFKQHNYKSHRRHPTRIKIKHTTPPSKKSNSPVLLRRSPVQEQKHDETIREEDEEEKKEDDEEKKGADNEEKKEEREEKNLFDDNDSITDIFDRYASKTSLQSIEE